MAANLKGADLREVDFLGADLRDAQLHGANMKDALFFNPVTSEWSSRE